MDDVSPARRPGPGRLAASDPPGRHVLRDAGVLAVVPTVAGRPIVDILSWGLTELGVPPLGEPRSFRTIARYVARFARSPDEIQIVIVPRFGAVIVEDGAAFGASMRH